MVAKRIDAMGSTTYNYKRYGALRALEKAKR